MTSNVEIMANSPQSSVATFYEKMRENFLVPLENCVFPSSISLLIFGFSAIFFLIFVSVSAVMTAFSIVLFVAGGLMIRYHSILLVFYIFNAVSICYVVVFYAFFGSEYFLSSNLFELYERAIFYFALGYCSLAIGLRIVLGNRPIAIMSPDAPMKIEYLLFAYLVFNYIVSSVLIGTGSQIGYAMALYRDVILYWVILECIFQRRGWQYVLLLIFLIAVPGATSHRSEWSLPLFVVGFSILIFAMSNEDKPGLEKYRSKLILLSAILVLLLGGLGVFWNGGLKSSWRYAVTSGAVGESTVGRLEALPDFIDRAAEKFRFEVAAESFASRLSAGVPFFALVLARVPEITPHQDGRLILRAASHVLQPRFLFPDKEDLGSDSDITSEFTGLRVAGVRQNTSIGLGYIPQFYIDFGVFGVILGSFVLGCMMGLFLLMLRSSAILPRLAAATWAAYLTYIFQSHASDLAKLCGAMVSLGVMFYAFNRMTGPVVRYWLERRQISMETGSPGLVEPGRP
ncbi:MAG: hypothetical protein VYB54_00680 [Pseudomonadota bacterium]|nr:hypothetical protein [Pseudomonadota bacterium]